MTKAMVDLMANGAYSGELASHLAKSGSLDVGSFRPYIAEDGKAYITTYMGGDRNKLESYVAKEIQANATTLRRDEWIHLDEAVLNVRRYRLGGIQDLIDNGLVYNLGNAFGTTVLEYHDVNDAFEADLTMDGLTRAKGDRALFGVHYLPIPIIHADYEINARQLEASRKLGNPLDTIHAEMAARRVMEKLENMLFTDTTYTFGGGTIYSYLNFGSKNNVSLSTAWNASGKTAAQILADVIAMKQASIDAKHYGPWKLYVPTAYETVLDEDYDTTTPGTTIRERILKVDGITGIKIIDTLPADNVLLVQMTPDVVRLIRGMDIQNVEWQVEGKFVTKYKVMTIQVPQIRADYNGNCGIVHLA